MKLRYIFLLIVLIAITGCTRPAKVRSLSNTSGRLPASQSMNEEEQKAFHFATLHGDERVFQYGYGSKTAFFKTSKYCYSPKEDAMKFVTNDNQSLITVPLEDVQACLGGTKIVRERDASDVFVDFLTSGAEAGVKVAVDAPFEMAEENLGLALLGFVLLPVGVVVGATVGTVIGGTVGLFAMGIDAAVDQGTRVCREYYDEESEEEFLMSHLCFDD